MQILRVRMLLIRCAKPSCIRVGIECAMAYLKIEESDTAREKERDRKKEYQTFQMKMSSLDGHKYGAHHHQRKHCLWSVKSN